MLSRVAENLYWISRYVERAEGLARLLEHAFLLELESGSVAERRPLHNVLVILNARAEFDKDWLGLQTPDGDVPRSAVDERDAILRFLTFHRADGISIRGMIGRARENARGTQETLSGEAWSQLNQLHLYLARSRAEHRFAATPVRFLDRIRRECVLFAALIDGTLPRTEAFHFLRVGRYLERVDVLSRIINVHCHAEGAFVPVRAGEPGELTFAAAHWAGLLRGTSAYEAYLKQARERIDPVSVVRYLLLEADFPRSMRFAVARCLESLRAVAGGGYGSDAERHLGRLDAELRYMDVDDLFHRGVGPFLVSVQDICAAVGRDVHNAYFRT